MILYLDTSALVKLYVEESSSQRVSRSVSDAKAAAASVLAFVETRSAFARLFREKALKEESFVELKSDFLSDWPNYVRVGLLPIIVERAAELAEAFSLRAYDSVHLASAIYLQDSLDEEIQFGCFDRRLNQAAKALGMSVIFVD